MRGRTLNNSFVLIDEAQNCTYGQLKMLLTRLGWHSTMVMTGDPDQTDLLPELSGLATIGKKLEGLRGRRRRPPHRPGCGPPSAGRPHAVGAVKRPNLSTNRNAADDWTRIGNVCRGQPFVPAVLSLNKREPPST